MEQQDESQDLVALLLDPPEDSAPVVETPDPYARPHLETPIEERVALANKNYLDKCTIGEIEHKMCELRIELERAHLEVAKYDVWYAESTMRPRDVALGRLRKWCDQIANHYAD
jgi:hypothetical protein